MFNTSFWIFIIIVVIYIAETIRELIDEEKKNKLFKIIISVILILLFITAFYLDYKEEERKERYNKNSGVFENKLDKNIKRPSICTTGSGSLTPSSSEKVGKTPLSMWLDEDNKLKINTTITDNNGNILAIIKENNWFVNPKSIDYLQKNSDDKALEVINQKNEVILQIQYNEKCLEISGIWHNNDGTGTYIETSNSHVKYGHLKVNESYILDVDRIFEYPADSFSGIRKK